MKGYFPKSMEMEISLSTELCWGKEKFNVKKIDATGRELENQNPLPYGNFEQKYAKLS